MDILKIQKLTDVKLNNYAIALTSDIRKLKHFQEMGVPPDEKDEEIQKLIDDGLALFHILGNEMLRRKNDTTSPESEPDELKTVRDVQSLSDERLDDLIKIANEVIEYDENEEFKVILKLYEGERARRNVEASPKPQTPTDMFLLWHFRDNEDFWEINGIFTTFDAAYKASQVGDEVHKMEVNVDHRDNFAFHTAINDGEAV